MYEFLADLPRPVKRLISLLLQLILVLISFYAALYLHFGSSTCSWMQQEQWRLLPLVVLPSVGVFVIFRLSSIKLTEFDTHVVMRIGYAAATLSASILVLCYLFGINMPAQVLVLFGTFLLIGSSYVRISGRILLQFLATRSNLAIPVAIFGAGSAGSQLAAALLQSREMRPVVFFDDNPTLRGMIVSSLKVETPKSIEKYIQRKKIKKILIAIPSISRKHQTELLERLSKYQVEVQIMPSFFDFLADRNPNITLKTVSADDFLGREKVDLNNHSVANTYSARMVMVTGAGGSIGSEICRQLLETKLRGIVLYEQSEFALYKIDQELRPLAESVGISVIARLGSVTNRKRLEQMLRENQVDIIFHAAAYKHVPLVEENEIEGVQNNVFGTLVAAEAALSVGVECFVLVSSDKAVRPTNVMGATKRAAEMIVGDLQSRSPKTKFSMVRFGNVLGSSGSVLPLFRRQIAMGGPVTVTHPDVIRYFMTISEAARLVLLSGAFATGGDLFVLNMGEPMRILDIARRMIVLSGQEVKESGSDTEGIEIKISGLRPGEKLYEELLIDVENLSSTPHEKIFRAFEKSLSEVEIAEMLKEFRRVVALNDVDALRAVISRYIEGYHVQGASTQG